MHRRVKKIFEIWGFSALLLLIAVGGFFMLARLSGESVRWAISLTLAMLLAAGGWWAAVVFRTRERQALRQQAGQTHELEQQNTLLDQTRARLEVAERSRAENERRLRTVLNLNRSLVEAGDEPSLMDAALSAITGLVGALGCSFVPVDEWEQPLPAFTYGQLPEPVLRAWADHLASSYLRERCGQCSVLQSTPGGCPLHPQSVGNALTVYCLALRSQPLTHFSPANPSPLNLPAAQLATVKLLPAAPRAGRVLGILHLYLPPGRHLDDDTRLFLEGLLHEIALAIELVRLREQELSTLRQIQMLHAPEGGLADLLGTLLEGLQQALEADFIILQLRASSDERLSGMNIQRGAIEGMRPEELDDLFNHTLAGEVLSSPSGASPAWLALPLRLPEGQVPGMLLVGSNHAHGFHPRQEAMLHTVAAQAALLVENERILRSLEYRAVIQERTRLAREIHDGLAQTLAFLKLQAAQMQSYLTKGDMARLGQVLKDNYAALAEAYLDTRQAIDNLRLTPRAGLDAWLEKVTVEFQNTTGLVVERAVQPLGEAWTTALTPEVQAQLMRVVQEALNNVRKHARAGRVWVSLREWQEMLVLEIGDDGHGFAAEDVPEVSQHGLRGMRERAELLGADFQIISQAHQGTVVRLTLPGYLKEAAQ